MAPLRYRGRNISEEDILYIRELIATHPGVSRRRLSAKLCEAWQWRQTNGALRDMVCRGLLLMLHRAGWITLPPVNYVRHNPLAHRVRPSPMLIDATPIEDRLCNLQPLEFRPVRSGRGKQSNSWVPNRSIKEVLGYPLTPKFRDLLGQL